MQISSHRIRLYLSFAILIERRLSCLHINTVIYLIIQKINKQDNIKIQNKKSTLPMDEDQYIESSLLLIVDNH